MRHWRLHTIWPILRERGHLHLILAWLISLAIGWIVSRDWLAAATFGLAFVTLLLVLETREGRMQGEQQRKELAFRAALVELADNILNYRRWDPSGLIMQVDPDPYWWDHPLQFTQLNKLLSSVDIAPQLFAWITGERGNIQVRERQLRADLKERKVSELSNEKKNELMEKAYWLDLYLVRLACYVVCEAKRQGFHTMAEGIEKTGVFRPMPWSYSRPDETPLTTAKLAEVAEAWWPAMSKLLESDIPGCDQCKLEKLIQLANEELKQLSSKIKGSDTGIEVAPGDFI
jgi:hypothetical protein